MANFTNFQEGKVGMLMLETQQRGLGTKSSATAANGDTSTGEPSSPLINIGGARFPHPPASNVQNTQSKDHQQYHTSAQQHFSNEKRHLDSPVRNSSSPSINPLMIDDDSPASVSSAQTVATATGAANANVSPITFSDGVDDIRKCGYLRKQKHGHKRFFVLRAASHLGPSRLEYYDSEKKFRNSLRSAAAAAAAAAASSTSVSSGGTATTSPKRVIYLYQCFTVNKRADSKNKHLIALYTKDEYFAIVAENEQEQEDWYQALSEQMSEGKRGHLDSDDLDDGYGTVLPGTVFKEVWQVNVKPKGLGQSKNLTGVYRLCLSPKSIHLVKLNSETPCVNLQLMNIRRCGHSESFFFIEVGRSSSIGPGEIWMQVDDSVVAQSMHETILDTMKALKAFAEFRPRSKSQSSGTNPIAFITTRRHLLPSAGGSQSGLHRRSRTESMVGTPPSSKSSGASGWASRCRTSSEGEGTMSRPFRSVTGSLLHLNSGRPSLGRQEASSSVGAGSSGGGGGGCGRYVRALAGSSTYHTRSASLPVSHFPSTSSPVSVSSSSGHGSVSDTLTRPSSASLCGSPSDGGFNSSDEYGSSPGGDMRYFRVRSNTPESLGNTPPIREEHSLSDYMAMGWQRDGESGLRDDVLEEDRFANSVRRRTPSFSRQLPSGGGGGGGGGGGVAMYQKMTQTALSLDEVVGEGSLSSSLRSDYSSSSEHSQARAPHHHHHAPPPLSPPPPDEGYMPMMPGVLGPGLTPGSDSSDYMPMQPSSGSSSSAVLSPTMSPQARMAFTRASPIHLRRQQPQQHEEEEDARGYMMMLPGAGRSTPQSHLAAGGSTEQSGNGEYMDMTCAPRRTHHHHHPRDVASDARYVPEVPGAASTPYFSLPRSYKAPARGAGSSSSSSSQHDEYVPMSPPAKPVPSPVVVDPSSAHLASRAVRPTRLPLGRRSFHGTTPPPTAAAAASREAPPSPGEYINIQYSEHRPPPAYSSSSMGRSSSTPSPPPPLPPPHQHEDYMCLDSLERCYPPPSNTTTTTTQAPPPRPSLVAPWNPPSYIRPVPSSSSSSSSAADGSNLPDSDYTEMTFGLGRADAGSPSAMLQHLCVLESPPVASEPKVIRADLQGRRRHSSETFTSVAVSPGGTTVTGTNSSVGGGGGGGGGGTCGPSPFSSASASASQSHSSSSPRQAEGARWQSPSAFDSVWMCVEGSSTAAHGSVVASAVVAAASAPSSSSSSADAGGPEGLNPMPGYLSRSSANVPTGYQNGLNYIALDLQEDAAPPPRPGATTASNVPSSSSQMPAGSGAAPVENGAYASIDFSKREEL
ncbi:insulin receptor substrate 2-B [Engraulis encrasicolus]|uniref:insulin receptor substrate 2-B n=1 Tax=Engraulis encrasicolus TaxID=184585 RepID=UPI002FD7425C